MGTIRKSRHLPFPHPKFKEKTWSIKVGSTAYQIWVSKIQISDEMKWVLDDHQHNNTDVIQIRYIMKKLKTILRKLYSILKRTSNNFLSKICCRFLDCLWTFIMHKADKRSSYMANFRRVLTRQGLLNDLSVMKVVTGSDPHVQIASCTEG
jgi:hypothetical protein